MNKLGNKPIDAPVQRLSDVDVAKGLAIFLVVFGHIVARQPPVDNGWYLTVKAAIYSFHMAFFMFLSGVVFFLKMEAPVSIKDYFLKVWKRFLRLMPAYFLFAIIVFLAKLIAQHFMYVDNPVNSYNDLLGIMLYPMISVSAFLWYIYVLFLYCAIGLLFISLGGSGIWILTGLGIILLFVNGDPFLGMDQFCKFLLFFALGGVAIRNWKIYNMLTKWIWVPAIIVFLLILATSNYFGDRWIPTALISLIALHGLCKQKLIVNKVFKFLGLMSFPIYLMNTLCIGFIKAIMIKIISWHGINFFIYVPILTLSGLFGPILLKKYVIRHLTWIDSITS